MPTRHSPFDRLAAALDGEVHDDLARRRLVAQDASPYRTVPRALAEPRHEADCERIVAFAAQHELPLIARGGGTGLAGQCVGHGLVVDTSRHMNAVLDIDPDAATARVQPGVTAAQLNAALAPHGLVFGPDPSTANRATLGGMLGNNAWGPHAPVDGSTRDQVIAIRAVLADGTARKLGRGADADETDRARRRGLAQLLADHAAAVRGAWPSRAARLCSNTGYPLHCLIDDGGSGDRADSPNEAILFAGAEGTLGLVTEITLLLRPLRRERRLLCPHFDDLSSALRAVRPALAAGACAVELLDGHVLGLTRDHPGQADNRFWIAGEPAAVLLVEFADGAEPGDLARRLRAAGASTVPEVTGPEIERAWALRRAGLGLLMGETAARRPVTGLEDTAVPIDQLPGYIEAVGRLMAGEGVDCVHYGSVSMGLVHLRPLLNLASADDRARYRRLLDGLAALVVAHEGVWATKHGVGRLRAPWLARVLGDDAVAAMRAVKTLYDPDMHFNPGKIVDPPDPLEDLRAATGAGATLPVTGMDWSDDRGLAAAAGRCQGAGACRKSATDGAMCPSYQATREEMHSTRGRANLFQQAIDAADPAAALGGEDLHEAMALCLSCKACRHECPASVDMARLKAEHQYQYGRRHGFPLAARVIAAFAGLSALAARTPRLANTLGRSRALQRLAGLAGPPPALAHVPLTKWLAARTPAPDVPRGRVVLALDPHTVFYEPAVGRAAVAVIERLGFAVRTTGCVSAGRPAISQGCLGRARAELRHWLRAVEAAGPGDAAIIGLEPSELLTLRDEAPHLVGAAWESRARAAAGRAVLFEEWLTAQSEALHQACADCNDAPRGRVAVHVHCHAKAARATDATLRALAMLPGTEVSLLPAGCCGMAGAFGHQRSTAGVSRQIAELALAPAIRDLDPTTTIAAHGTSCRQQIARVTGRQALHPAAIVAQALGLPSEDA